MDARTYLGEMDALLEGLNDDQATEQLGRLGAILSRLGYELQSGEAPHFNQLWAFRRPAAVPPVIWLDESIGLGLILPLPGGVLYYNQTQGTDCLHQQAEGLYVPLRNYSEDGMRDGRRNREYSSPEHALVEHFCGPKHQGSGARLGLDHEDADVIDAILAAADLAGVTRVDRSKLAESHEAWVHVVVLGDDTHSGVFESCGPYPRPAILTWGNSD